MNVENPKVGRFTKKKKENPKPTTQQTNKQTNKKGIIKVRSDKLQRDSEIERVKQTSTLRDKECQHTSGYDAFLSKQSVMQNKSKAGQNSHG